MNIFGTSIADNTNINVALTLCIQENTLDFMKTMLFSLYILYGVKCTFKFFRKCDKIK